MTDAEFGRSSTERLALLIRVAQAFNSSLDLDQVLGRVIVEVIAAVHAERGFVMLHEAGISSRFAWHAALIRTPSMIRVSRSRAGFWPKWRQRAGLCLPATRKYDDRFSMRQSIVGQLTYVNAGHDAAILCADSRDRCAILERTGLVLGVAEDAVYTHRMVQLEPGGCVLLHTDGAAHNLQVARYRLDAANYGSAQPEPTEHPGQDAMPPV